MGFVVQIYSRKFMLPKNITRMLASTVTLVHELVFSSYFENMGQNGSSNYLVLINILV